VPQPDNPADAVAGGFGGAQDAGQRPIDDGSRAAGLPDDERSAGWCGQGEILSRRAFGGARLAP